MKFTVTQKSLIAALSICGKAVNAGLVISTGSFRFKGTNSKLEISGCNMEFSIAKELEIISTDTFDILIPAIDITKLVSSLPDQPIEFTFDDLFFITIKHKSGEYKIQGYDGIDFPVITTDGEKSLTIPFEDITEAIYKTSFARHIDATGNRLNGLNMEFSKKGIVTVGACAGRISVYHIDGKYKDGSVLLPINFVNSLATLKLQGETKLTYSENSITLELDGMTVKSSLMAEKYVDWQSVIPTMETYVTIDRSDVLSAVKRVLDFANKDKTIIFHIADKLTISAGDKQQNRAGEEVVNIDVPGNDIRIGNNGDYLIDALSHFSCNELLMYFEDPKKPLIFKESLEDVNISLVAPQMI